MACCFARPFLDGLAKIWLRALSATDLGGNFWGVAPVTQPRPHATLGLSDTLKSSPLAVCGPVVAQAPSLVFHSLAMKPDALTSSARKRHLPNLEVP